MKNKSNLLNCVKLIKVLLFGLKTLAQVHCPKSCVLFRKTFTDKYPFNILQFEAGVTVVLHIEEVTDGGEHD